MNDRKLLELAAKAAGFIYRWLQVGEVEQLRVCYSSYPARGQVFDKMDWNPLVDDGDALRLANNLGLTIGNTYDSAYVDLCSGEILQLMKHGCQHEAKWADHGGDRNAACRRAIVRAAAAIGSYTP